MDGSNSDSDSCNTDKSQNDMKCIHVEIMEDLSKKKVGRSLQSCIVGASNGNAEADVGISEETSDTEAGACPRCKTLYDKAEGYSAQWQAKFPNDKIPYLTDSQKMGYYLHKKEFPFLHNFDEQLQKFQKFNCMKLECSKVF